jgi:protein subunit release factor A
VHDLDQVLTGRLDRIVDALKAADREDRLKNL